MRKAVMEVPEEVIGDFSDRMVELELDNTILGRSEDNDLLIEVHYEKDESKEVDELEEYLAELIAELDETEEEDEN